MMVLYWIGTADRPAARWLVRRRSLASRPLLHGDRRRGRFFIDECGHAGTGSCQELTAARSLHVIASEAKQSIPSTKESVACFVALLLAM